VLLGSMPSRRKASPSRLSPGKLPYRTFPAILHFSGERAYQACGLFPVPPLLSRAWVLVSDATPIRIPMLSCRTRCSLIPPALILSRVIRVAVSIPVMARLPLGPGRSLGSRWSGCWGRGASGHEQP
jgi:hypothetical protein